MMTVFALVLLSLSVWASGSLQWWWVVLSIFLALLDLGARITEAKARKPYVSFEDAEGDVSPLHWMSDALIDLSADLRSVLNEIESNDAS